MATPDTPPERDPYDGDYVGNIFGWKISLIGAGVLLFFVALLTYRHISMDVPIGFDDPLESEEEKARFAPPSARNDTTRIQ